jgi:hypothetical protein
MIDTAKSDATSHSYNLEIVQVIPGVRHVRP